MPSQTSLKPVKNTHAAGDGFFSTRASLSWVKRRTVKLILDKERIFSYQTRSLGPRSACHVVLVPKRDMFFATKSHNLGWKVLRLSIIHNFFHTFSTYLICSAVQPSAGHLRCCALEAPKKSGGFNPSFLAPFYADVSNLTTLAKRDV